LNLRLSTIASRWFPSLGLAAALLTCGCKGLETRSASDIAGLKAAASGADKEGTFHVRGVVTFVEPVSNFFVVQDSTGGLRITSPRSRAALAVGDLVEVSGFYEDIGGETLFEASQATTVQQRAIQPQAIAVRFDTDRDEHRDSYRDLYRDDVPVDRRASLVGHVDSAALDRRGLASFAVTTGRKRVTVKAILIGPYDLDHYVDAQIQATGVLTRHPGGEGDALELLVPDSHDVVIREAAVPPNQIRVSAIKDLTAAAPGSSSSRRVRVKGRVLLTGGSEWTVADKTGRIRVQFAENWAPGSGDTVDLAGFRSNEGPEPALIAATPVAGAPDETACPGGIDCRRVFRTVKSVHDLTPEAAWKQAPVELDAVVTYSDPGSNRLFVQDATDGIFVQLEAGEAWRHRAGDRVRVTGVTAPGSFAPMIRHARFQVVGRSPMPKPNTDLESIFAGRHVSRWVKVSGVIQDATATKSEVIATIGWASTTFEAHILAPLESVRKLINERVTIQAVCGTHYNTHRQMIGVTFYVPDLRFVAPQQTGQKQMGATPLRTATNLLEFSPDLDLSHRVRIQGTVTLAARTGPTWIADAKGNGIRIESHQPAEIREGDFVEAEGFPAAAGYSALLRAAVVKRLQRGSPIQAVRTMVDEAARGSADSQLIQVRGRLVDETVREGLRTLTLQSGRTTFLAQLPAERTFPALHPASLLLVTGICSTVVGNREGVLVPTGFRLDLRSGADVSIVKDAPWLTFTRLLEIFSVTGLLAILSLFWAALLRRHVRARTAELREKSLQLQSAYEQSNFQATHDALTGLPNRFSFKATLELGIENARRDGGMVVLMYIDLNEFKQVNDSLGHLVGDELLKSAAQRLAPLVNGQSTLARVGGDEFALLIPSVDSLEDMPDLAFRMNQALEDCFAVSGHEVYIGASIGISVFPDSANDATELQKTADIAMYSVKSSNQKNGFAWFSAEMRDTQSDRLQMEADLRAALARDEMIVYFQPTVGMDGELAGFEALVRWEHPRLGLLPPGRFIPLAEETGLISPIGDWVLRESCRCAAQWQTELRRDLKIAVNVSAVQLNRSNFADIVEDVLAETGLPPELLELELTESILVTDIAGAAAKMRRLGNSGVRFALDDFGQGHWSFIGLRQLPLDTLKIDRSLIADSEGSESTRYVIESIIKMAHHLQLSVTAEGVESEAQSRILRKLGCDLGQGYLFGRPTPAENAVEMIKRLSGRESTPRQRHSRRNAKSATGSR
jgi:diguanylate cyclase (GGDEF)-like protein